MAVLAKKDCSVFIARHLRLKDYPDPFWSIAVLKVEMCKREDDLKILRKWCDRVILVSSDICGAASHTNYCCKSPSFLGTSPYISKRTHAQRTWQRWLMESKDHSEPFECL
jgi:hypothetical protein